MRCTSPRTVGFLADGKTITWSPKTFSKEFSTFQLPCSKCLACRLDYARQWAVRCVHESQMHPKNSFITLTYNDENLGDNKLDYVDFQKFMKKLRKLTNEPIGMFVTGEYGEKSKRKHWHAILFGWEPPDLKHKFTTPRGDKNYSSETLDKLWGLGDTIIGSVTVESAGYCARYAAKKLSHGKDSEHNLHPISKKSSKNAIGKKWLEQNWPDIFLHGKCILMDGQQAPVPRYYEKWFKENHPEGWKHYVTQTKLKIIEEATAKEEKLNAQEKIANLKRSGLKGLLVKRNQVRKKILQQKIEKLTKHAKV